MQGNQYSTQKRNINNINTKTQQNTTGKHTHAFLICSQISYRAWKCSENCISCYLSNHMNEEKHL